MSACAHTHTHTIVLILTTEFLSVNITNTSQEKWAAYGKIEKERQEKRGIRNGKTQTCRHITPDSLSQG